METIPTCYFPTKIIFVDDNYSFLSSMRKKLDYQDHSFEFHTNTNLALKLINDTSVEKEIAGYFHQILESDLCDSKVVEYKMRDICRLIYNKNRFDIRSVAFIDYDMPSMDGIDFCRQITNKSIKKVLLTGIADELVAIEAFNKGLIDGYIKKQDDNLMQKVASFISELTIKYFNELTYKREIEAFGEESSATNIVEFIEIFEDIVKDNDIVEFYQFDPTGSFLMIDASGSIKTLYVSNDIKNARLLSGIEPYFDEDLFQDIKYQILKEHKILCYHSDKLLIDEEDFPWFDEIEKQLFPSKSTKGNPCYYYAVHDGMYPIDSDRVYSFKSY